MMPPPMPMPPVLWFSECAMTPYPIGLSASMRHPKRSRKNCWSLGPSWPMTSKCTTALPMSSVLSRRMRSSLHRHRGRRQPTAELIAVPGLSATLVADEGGRMGDERRTQHAAWGSDDVAARRPAGELTAVGQLQLAQHRRDMRLNGAFGQDELLGGFAIGVAAGDQP